jgi:hypothetical protein
VRERDNERDRGTDRERQTDRETERDKERQRETERYRQTDRQTDREIAPATEQNHKNLTDKFLLSLMTLLFYANVGSRGGS